MKHPELGFAVISILAGAAMLWAAGWWGIVWGIIYAAIGVEMLVDHFRWRKRRRG